MGNWQTLHKLGLGLSLAIATQPLILTAGMATLVLASPVAAATPVQWRFDPNSRQLEFALPEGATPRYFLVAQPARIVVELPNTDIGAVTNQQQYSGAVRQVRVAQFQPGVARIVIELSPDAELAPGQVELRRIGTSGGRTRWAVRPLLVGDSQTATRPAPTAPASPARPAPAPAQVAPPPSATPVPPATPRVPPSGASPVTPTPPAGRPSTLPPAAVQVPPSSAPSAPPLLPPAAESPSSPNGSGVAIAPPSEPPSAPFPPAQPDAALPPAQPPIAITPPIARPSVPAVPSLPQTRPSEQIAPTPQTSQGTSSRPFAPTSPPPANRSGQLPPLEPGAVQIPIQEPPATVRPIAPTAQEPPPAPTTRTTAEPPNSPSTASAPPAPTPAPRVTASPNSPPAARPTPTAPPGAVLPPPAFLNDRPVTVQVPPPSGTAPSATVPPAPNRSTPPSGAIAPPPPLSFPSPSGQRPPVVPPSLPPASATVPSAPLPTAQTTAVRPYNPNVLLPEGTVLRARYPRTTPLELSANQTRQEVLLLEESVRDRTGNVVFPRGSQVIGRFETGRSGSKFIAQAVSVGGRNLLIQGESEPLAGDREVSSNRLLRNSAIGALGATLLGVLTGGIGFLGLAAGAATGAATTYFTAPKPAVVQPNQVVEVRLTEDLPR